MPVVLRLPRLTTGVLIRNTWPGCRLVLSSRWMNEQYGLLALLKQELTTVSAWIAVSVSLR